MKIQNTWQTIAEPNKREGGITFGYEASASVALLRQLQKDQVLVEVVGKTPSNMPRLIRPDNPDRQVFTSDQKFRIMENNQTFGRFEKALSNACGGLPENRFDEFVSWVDPKVYKRTVRGYCLSLDRLSDKKKQELSENLTGLSNGIKDNKILVSGKKNIDAIEFTWKEAAKQNKTKSTNPIMLSNREIRR